MSIYTCMIKLQINPFSTLGVKEGCPIALGIYPRKLANFYLFLCVAC